VRCFPAGFLFSILITYQPAKVQLISDFTGLANFLQLCSSLKR
jgi:hypothetical protein